MDNVDDGAGGLRRVRWRPGTEQAVVVDASVERRAGGGAALTMRNWEEAEAEAAMVQDYHQRRRRG